MTVLRRRLSGEEDGGPDRAPVQLPRAGPPRMVDRIRAWGPSRPPPQDRRGFGGDPAPRADPSSRRVGAGGSDHSAGPHGGPAGVPLPAGADRPSYSDRGNRSVSRGQQ